jgi:hypothetical protein
MTVADRPGEHERDPVVETSATVIPLGHRSTPATGSPAQRVRTPDVVRVTPDPTIAAARPINGDSGVDSETARRRRMADIRAEMVDVISHGVLFSMAQERGVSGGLVVASRWDLLDAILRAEGLRAEDGNATAEDVERLDQLLREACRRNAEATNATRTLEAERTIRTSPPRERRSHHR